MVSMKHSRQGFTIVEIIIVIIVIAILAIIGAVSYNGITKNARETSLKSDLKNAHAQIEVDKSKANGVYPLSAADINGGKGLAKTKGNSLTYHYDADSKQFCVEAYNDKEDTEIFHIVPDGTISKGLCPSFNAIAGPSSGERITYRNFGGGGEGTFCAVTQQDWIACWMIDTTWPEYTTSAIPRGNVPADVGYKAVASTQQKACGLTTNEKWYCWSYNNGSNTYTTPQEMPQGEIASGVRLMYISMNSSSVGIFGSDQCYYTADITGNNTPVKLGCNYEGETNVSYDMGANHQCLVTNLVAQCIGSNSNGQLGNNGVSDSATWTDIVANGALNNKTIRQIDVGKSNTCVVASDGNVYCWGANGTQDALGNNSTSPSNSRVPVQVNQGQIPVGAVIQKVSVGGGQACALSTAGLAYCWGFNTNGAVGDGTTTSPRRAPRAVIAGEVPSGVTFKDIAASVNSNSCAIGTDNELYCWGRHRSSVQTTSPKKYLPAYYP